MKKIIILTMLFAACSFKINAQTSPCLVRNNSYHYEEGNNIRSLNDTLTFSPFSAGTIMTTQYLNKGVVFSGYDGSTDPVIYHYGPPQNYGNVLTSDNWFNPLRMNFTDTANAAIYHLATKIEFDNIIDNEVDFISINVYDSLDVLLYHYLSTSPEHVVIDFTTPMAAYITIDDSANTAYVVDNILIDNVNLSGIGKNVSSSTKVFPNPFSNQITVELSNNEQTTIILYDIFTRQIMQQTFTNSAIINTEQLADGIYFYQLRISNRIITSGKIIKN